MCPGFPVYLLVLLFSYFVFCASGLTFISFRFLVHTIAMTRAFLWRIGQFEQLTNWWKSCVLLITIYSLCFCLLLIFRYTKHVPPSRYGYSSKSITRTLSCIGLQNHFCWHSLPSYVGQPNWNIAVPTDIGKSHHYKKCHFDKFLHKKRLCHRIVTTSNVTTDRAMFRFREKLANAVANKLLELDLVELAPDV